MTLIIAISGKLGTGKDYTLNKVKYYINTLNKNINYANMSFANPIKLSASSKYNIDLDLLYEGRKSKDIRILLQKEGDKSR